MFGEYTLSGCGDMNGERPANFCNEQAAFVLRYFEFSSRLPTSMFKLKRSSFAWCSAGESKARFSRSMLLLNDMPGCWYS
jgi:hypothetical protein